MQYEISVRQDSQTHVQTLPGVWGVSATARPHHAVPVSRERYESSMNPTSRWTTNTYTTRRYMPQKQPECFRKPLICFATAEPIKQQSPLVVEQGIIELISQERLLPP
jgi:hypothetical protein